MKNYSAKKFYINSSEQAEGLEKLNQDDLLELFVITKDICELRAAGNMKAGSFEHLLPMDKDGKRFMPELATFSSIRDAIYTLDADLTSVVLDFAQTRHINATNDQGFLGLWGKAFERLSDYYKKELKGVFSSYTHYEKAGKMYAKQLAAFEKSGLKFPTDFPPVLDLIFAQGQQLSGSDDAKRIVSTFDAQFTWPKMFAITDHSRGEQLTPLDIAFLRKDEKWVAQILQKHPYFASMNLVEGKPNDDGSKRWIAHKSQLSATSALKSSSQAFLAYWEHAPGVSLGQGPMGEEEIGSFLQAKSRGEHYSYDPRSPMYCALEKLATTRPSYFAFEALQKIFSVAPKEVLHTELIKFCLSASKERKDEQGSSFDDPSLRGPDASIAKWLVASVERAVHLTNDIVLIRQDPKNVHEKWDLREGWVQQKEPWDFRGHAGSPDVLKNFILNKVQELEAAKMNSNKKGFLARFKANTPPETSERERVLVDGFDMLSKLPNLPGATPVEHAPLSVKAALIDPPNSSVALAPRGQAGVVDLMESKTPAPNTLPSVPPTVPTASLEKDAPWEQIDSERSKEFAQFGDFFASSGLSKAQMWSIYSGLTRPMSESAFDLMVLRGALEIIKEKAPQLIASATSTPLAAPALAPPLAPPILAVSEGANGLPATQEAQVAQDQQDPKVAPEAPQRTSPKFYALEKCFERAMSGRPLLGTLFHEFYKKTAPGPLDFEGWPTCFFGPRTGFLKYLYQDGAERLMSSGGASGFSGPWQPEPDTQLALDCARHMPTNSLLFALAKRHLVRQVCDAIISAKLGYSLNTGLCDAKTPLAAAERYASDLVRVMPPELLTEPSSVHGGLSIGAMAGMLGSLPVLHALWEQNPQSLVSPTSFAPALSCALLANQTECVDFLMDLKIQNIPLSLCHVLEEHSVSVGGASYETQKSLPAMGVQGGAEKVRQQEKKQGLLTGTITPTVSARWAPHCAMSLHDGALLERLMNQIPNSALLKNPKGQTLVEQAQGTLGDYQDMVNDSHPKGAVPNSVLYARAGRILDFFKSVPARVEGSILSQTIDGGAKGAAPTSKEGTSSGSNPIGSGGPAESPVLSEPSAFAKELPDSSGASLPYAPDLGLNVSNIREKSGSGTSITQSVSPSLKGRL